MTTFDFTTSQVQQDDPETSPSPSRFDFTSGSPAPVTAPVAGSSRFDFTGGDLSLTPQVLQAAADAAVNEFSPVEGGTVPAPGETEGFSVGGLLKNTVGGIAGAVEGIGNIIVGGVQDTVGQVQKLDFIPGLGGEQSLEKRINEEGSSLVRVAFGPGDDPSLFNSVSEDLKYRWGPLLEGDLEQFMHRMYDQPVSFLLDAAAVGSGVAAPFKVAEKAGVAAQVAKGTPYAVARAEAVASRSGLALSILGPGSKELASFTSVAGKTVHMPSNPVTRAAKDFFIRTISTDLEQTFQGLRAGTPGYGLAVKGYNVGRAGGAERVLKPTWSRLAEARAVGLMAGLKRSRLGDLRAEALSELEQPYLLGTKGLDNASFIEHIQGSAPTTDLPGVGQIDLHMDEFPEIPAGGELPPVMEVTDVQRLAHARALTAEFGADGVKPAPFDAPHAPDATGARYEVIVGTMTQAQDALKRAAETLGGRVLAVRNYFADGTEAWQGVHGFVETPDGVVEISVGTEKLFRAQSVASDIFKRRDFHATEAERYANEILEKTRAGAKPGRIAALEARRAFHAREVEAAQYLGSAMFEGPFRETYALMNDMDYDPNLAAADEMRVWSHKWMAQPELDHGLTFQTIMNRAYGPQRLTSFMYDMATLEENIPFLLVQFKNWNKAAPALMDAMAGLPNNLIADILDADFLNTLNLKKPQKAATAIVDRMRLMMRESVINGDIPEYSWQQMHSARMAESLPTPHYYPHLKISDLPMSDLAVPGKRAFKTAEPPNISKQWMGHLMEEGTFIMDPVEAYTRVFNSIARHHEVIRYLDNVLQTYGREVTKQEIETLRAVSHNPEEFINGIGAKAEISFRSMLEARTYDYIRQGLTVEKATTQAIQDLLPDLQKAALLAGNGKFIALPRHIAKQVKAELAREVGWKSRVFWDAPMAVWRASVLSFSPRWILNNTIGNLVFTGLKDPRAIFYAVRQLNKRQRTIMEFLIGPERLRDIERGFSHNLPSTYHRFSDEAVAASPRLARNVQRVQEALPSRGFRAVSQYVRSVNSQIEEAFRRGIYLSTAEKAAVQGFAKRFGSSKMLLDRLAREGITEATHKKALTQVDAVLGNYTNLSPREQDIVRRFIAPFYGFYRHVAKFTAKLPFEQPIAVKVLQQLGAIDDDMDRYLPEWLRESGIVGSFGDGQEMFLGLQSANPLNSIINAGEAPLAPLNPVAKVVLERLTGRNLFSGKDYSSGDVYEARDGTRWVYQRDDEGNVVGRPRPMGPHEYVLPPLWRHFALQFGPFNAIEKTIAATAGPGLGGQYSSTGNVITEDGVPVFPVEPWTIFTNYLGIPLYSFDVEAERRDYLASQQEALTAGGG